MRIYGGNLIKQKLCLIDPEKTLLCFNQTIAMLHLSIRILQCCNSHSFFSRISMCFSSHSEDADLYERKPKVVHG